MDSELQHETQRSIAKIDQRLTGHCILSQRYKKLAAISDYLLISATIILTVSSFSSDFTITHLQITKDRLDFYLSIFSLLVLIYTIIAWKADWRGKANDHDIARNALSRLKISGRELLAAHSSDSDLKSFLSDNAATQGMITPIPENKFHKIKAIHKRKIALSKFIDENAGLRPELIRLKFSLKNIMMFFNFKS